MYPASAQSSGAPSPPQNPFGDIVQPASPTGGILPQPKPFTDYRSQVVPQAQKHSLATPLKLKVFGDSFFQPARELIDARRRALQEMYAPAPFSQLQAAPGTAANAPITPQQAAMMQLPPNLDLRKFPVAVQTSAIRLDSGMATASDVALLQSVGLLPLSGSSTAPLTPAELATYKIPANLDLRLYPPNVPNAVERVKSSKATFEDIATLRAAGILPTPNLNATSGTVAAPSVPVVSPNQYSQVPDQTPYPAQPYGNPTPGATGLPYLSGSPSYPFTSPYSPPSNQYGASSGENLNAYRMVVDPLAMLYQNVAASAPSNYQLSGGDVLTIRYWSPMMQMHSQTVTVDQEGGITLDGVGRIVVRGQSLSQAQMVIQDEVRRVYRDAQVSVTLKDLRTMPVIVSGESYAPGTYQVPAVVTAMDLLYATGGPSPNGSYRDIEVRRNGKVIDNIDFYKFLITGAKINDIVLQPGDVLYIPPRGTQVSISGEVRNPGIYELKPGETLADALQYAGGIKPSGVAQQVQITTVNPGQSRIIKDVDANNPVLAAKTPLYDGDRVDVFSVRSVITNKVTVQGAVELPGEYAYHPGMKVSDLLMLARGLRDEAYTARADLYRYRSDNTLALIPIDLKKALAGDPAADVELKPWDSLKVYARDQVSWIGSRTVTINGAIQRPGDYYLAHDMHLKDLLLEAGGPTPDAYTHRAVLLHQTGTGEFSYDYVDLDPIVAGNEDGPVLKDNDTLIVYSANQAAFVPQHEVSIKGQVLMPGNYPRGIGMHLSDLIKLAGGFLPNVATEVYIGHARENTNTKPVKIQLIGGAAGPSLPLGDDPVLRDGDVVTVQGQGNYQPKPFVVTVDGAVKHPGPVILTGRLTRLSDAIQEAGGLRSDAFPQGASFHRKSQYLTTADQEKMASIVNQLNAIINEADYHREQAQADVERIKAIGKAAQPQLPIPISGLGVTPAAGTTNSGIAAGAQQLYATQLVTPARPLTAADLAPNGNVTINLEKALKDPKSSADILLKDGDSIDVPEIPSTVQVVGAIGVNQAVPYKKGQGVQYYVNHCGGFSPDAAKSRIEVVRLGGGMFLQKHAGKIQPGDMIVVPTKVMAARLTSSTSQIDSIIRTLTSSALIYAIVSRVLNL